DDEQSLAEQDPPGYEHPEFQPAVHPDGGPRGKPSQSASRREARGALGRAMNIRKFTPQFIQAVDQEENARNLSTAAKEAGVVADVVIDVAVGTRSGIPPGEGAVALAKIVDKLPNLKL